MEYGRKFPNAFKRDSNVNVTRHPFRQSYACSKANVCTLGWISDRKFVSLLFSARIFGAASAREILGDFGGGVTELQLPRAENSTRLLDQANRPQTIRGSSQRPTLRAIKLSAICLLLCVPIRVAARLNRIFSKAILGNASINAGFIGQ